MKGRKLLLKMLRRINLEIVSDPIHDMLRRINVVEIEE